MVLAFPIIPILVLLFWLFRWLSNRGTVPEAVVPKPAPAHPFAEVRISFGHVLLFALCYLPWAMAATALAGEISGWLGLLAFAAALFAIFMSPRWLAWRVLGPLGLVAVGRIVLWLAPSMTLRTFRGNLELFSAAFGGAPRPKRWTASSWFLFAHALRSEREGDSRRVEALLELLSGISPWQLPWRLRGQGVELLAWPALHSGRWEEALRRLASGRGRGVRLLRMLAAAHTGKAVSPRRLWLAWLLAPGRLRTRPLVLAALNPDGTRMAASPPPLDSAAHSADGAWLRHLRLLADAAEGREVRPADVEAVAASWERVLGKAGRMRLLSRGAELEVPDVQAVVAALRPTLQAELEAVTDCIEGPWPEPQRHTGLAAQVRRRRLDRLFAAVQVEVDPFLGRNGFQRTLEAPLVELERWLQFRRDLQRLLAAADEYALPTAWYNGLRLAACNWPVFLLRTYGREAHWACRQMFRWAEAQAQKVGDAEIARLSHGNLREVRTFLV